MEGPVTCKPWTCTQRGRSTSSSGAADPKALAAERRPELPPLITHRTFPRSSGQQSGLTPDPQASTVSLLRNMEMEPEPLTQRLETMPTGGGGKASSASCEDDEDDDYFDRIAAAAMQQDEDEEDRMVEEAGPMKGGGPMDEEAWCQAMIDHAVKSSVVKDESDSVWDHVLHSIVSQTVQDSPTFEAAVPITTELQRLVLRRFLEAGLPRTSVMLSQLAMAPSATEWFVNSLLEPTVALALQSVGADRVDCVVYALDASAAKAVLAACLRPAACLCFSHLDPILEGAVFTLLAARGLAVQHKRTQVLYALSVAPPIAPVSKHPRERSDLQVRLLAEEESKGPRISSSSYGLFNEDRLVGRVSIDGCGMLRSLCVDVGYRGRGFEGLLLGTVVELWRKGGEARQGRGRRPHVWLGGEEEEEPSAAVEAVLRGMGFQAVATAVTIQAGR